MTNDAHSPFIDDEAIYTGRRIKWQSAQLCAYIPRREAKRKRDDQRESIIAIIARQPGHQVFFPPFFFKHREP